MPSRTRTEGRRSLTLVAILLFAWDCSLAYALIGEEMIPLLQLVSGQVRQLEFLTEQLGVAKQQSALLLELNKDIQRVVSQIQSIETIIERTQGLNPQSARSLAELNDLLRRVRITQQDLESITELKGSLAEQALAESALQSETAYRMGQEMVLTGSELARESVYASPGRAAQIAASAQSAQMLSQGVELQTLAQIAQLQALQLDFQKAHAASRTSESDQRKQAFRASLEDQLRRRR
jgi:hypothetical protein